MVKGYLSSLKIGDLALDSFGKLRKIKEISYNGEDIYGKFYVGYHTEFGDNASCSMSQGEIYEEEELDHLREDYRKFLDKCDVCDDCGPTIRTVKQYSLIDKYYYLCDLCHEERLLLNLTNETKDKLRVR